MFVLKSFFSKDFAEAIVNGKPAVNFISVEYINNLNIRLMRSQKLLKKLQ
jgi:hypothetical protein